MIPAFKHSESMVALGEINDSGSNVVKKSKFPKEVVEDLIGYDKACYFFKNKHVLIFED